MAEQGSPEHSFKESLRAHLALGRSEALAMAFAVTRRGERKVRILESSRSKQGEKK